MNISIHALLQCDLASQPIYFRKDYLLLKELLDRHLLCEYVRKLKLDVHQAVAHNIACMCDGETNLVSISNLGQTFLLSAVSLCKKDNDKMATRGVVESRGADERSRLMSGLGSKEGRASGGRRVEGRGLEGSPGVDGMIEGAER